MRLLAFLIAVPVQAQLIQQDQPVPKTTAPPVVFINGFELNCPSATFSHSFGIADQVLQSAGRASLFFNYCVVTQAGSSIEDLGDAFGQFLAGLRYTDGTPVDQVDCVAYSMGGLILRSYLSGKRTGSATFRPPQNTHIRKVIFLATPNFGTGVAVGLPFSTTIVDELSSGSRFLFDLATWNQGADDLRGVDAIAAIGNGGTGLATTKGFDDGLVALTSASLAFYAPGRTRVLPYCHDNAGGLTSLAGFCDSNAKGIAFIDSPSHPTARLVLSFLAGTNDWQSIGTPPEQDPFLSKDGGLIVAMHDSNDVAASIDGVMAAGAAQSKSLNVTAEAYTDMFAAGALTLTGVAGLTRADLKTTLPASVYRAIVLKPGPVITGIAPAAGAVFALGAAPGEIVSIYGAGLDNAQVSLNGAAMQIYSVSATLINAVMPASASGFATFTVHNSAGRSSVNVLLQPAVPAVFTLDQSGSGAAAAIDATTGVLVDSSHPLRAGDYLALFLTGLGATTTLNGLDVANQQPTVTIAGQNCPVTYAGRVPGIAGLDQINCIVPQVSEQSAAPLMVISGNRASNPVTVAIQ